MAIKGVIKEELTSETILSKIDDYNIIKYYLGSDFDFKKSYHSPFRKDKDPNLRFFVNDTGRILWKDFANGMNGDAITFVMRLHTLSYHEALVKIDQDLGLGIKSPMGLKFKISKRGIPIYKKDNLIQIEQTSFDIKGLEYWSRYYISQNELINNEVYQVQKMWVNKQLMPPSNIRFAYLYGEHLKILSPEDKNYKWISNTPNDYMSGLDLLKRKRLRAKKLIISKSKKDEIILKKFYSDVISTQNESIGAFSKDNMKWILENYDEIWLWWDFDAPGIENAEKLSHIFNIVKDPDDLFKGHKDPSDLIKWTSLAYTREACYKLLKP